VSQRFEVKSLNFLQLFLYRYRHFIAKGGKSPFDRGACKNLVDFFECNLFGAFKPQHRDWLNFFWPDFEDDKSIEVEPLLRASDNYQYV
jgi:palmitoyltransferase ZDHHC13/17